MSPLGPSDLEWSLPPTPHGGFPDLRSICGYLRPETRDRLPVTQPSRPRTPRLPQPRPPYLKPSHSKLPRHPSLNPLTLYSKLISYPLLTYTSQNLILFGLNHILRPPPLDSGLLTPESHLRDFSHTVPSHPLVLPDLQTPDPYPLKAGTLSGPFLHSDLSPTRPTPLPPTPRVSNLWVKRYEVEWEGGWDGY